MACVQAFDAVKRGAPLFISVMERLGFLIAGLTMFQHQIEMPHFKQIRETGDYEGGYGFTACHFFLSDELHDALGCRGVKIMEMVGLEGISSHHRESVNHLATDENRWKNWLETHCQACTHPAVVGISEHMLIICSKS